MFEPESDFFFHSSPILNESVMLERVETFKLSLTNSRTWDNYMSTIQIFFRAGIGPCDTQCSTRSLNRDYRPCRYLLHVFQPIS